VFKLDPKKLQRVMENLGVQAEPIEATEVVIKSAGRELVIKNPKVQRIEMAGQASYQVVGETTEKVKSEIAQEDIDLVAQQAKVSRDKAEKALKKANGDIARAIMDLKGI